MTVHPFASTHCRRCGESGEYRNISLSRNRLLRRCSKCGITDTQKLPQLRKHIIYLDQHFLSHAFRGTVTPFVEAAHRVNNLVAKQVLISPWSDYHMTETHLWRHSKSAQLWSFIKKTALGKRFRQPMEVTCRQFDRQFDAFRTGTAPVLDVFPDDALERNVHDWSDFIWIDVGRSYDDSDALRDKNIRNVQKLKQLLIACKTSTSSFDNDVLSEVNAYAQHLIDLHNRYLLSFTSGNFETAMNSLDAAEPLRRLIEAAASDSNPAKSVESFLTSDHFRYTPEVDIAARLLAVLKKRSRAGRSLNRLSGILYDLDAIRFYAPYCDAIFVDKEMRHCLLDTDGQLAKRYNMRVFSSDTWVEFHEYLNKLDEKASRLEPDPRQIYAISQFNRHDDSGEQDSR